MTRQYKTVFKMVMYTTHMGLCGRHIVPVVVQFENMLEKELCKNARM